MQIDHKPSISTYLHIISTFMQSLYLKFQLGSIAQQYFSKRCPTFALQPCDTTGDIYRTTYTAFSFHKRAGVAAEKSVIKVCIYQNS